MNAIRRIVGVVLLVCSAAVLILATGNLVSLPFVARQVARAVPSAEPALSQAMAESRRKSCYGLAAGAGLGLAGAILVARRRCC
jgi:hypothetical protein